MSTKINLFYIYSFVLLVPPFFPDLFNGQTISRITTIVSIVLGLKGYMDVQLLPNKPTFIKYLDLFLLFFSFYGILYFIDNEHYFVSTDNTLREINPTDYILRIFNCTLPVYAFYSFCSQEYINKRIITLFFFIFLFRAIFVYYDSQQELIALSDTDETTNNSAYLFVPLLALIFIFKEKQVIFWSMLFVISFYILSCVKRGAILNGMISITLLIFYSYKNISARKRGILVLLIFIGFFALTSFIQYQLETSDYWVERIEQTLEGNTSSRDVIYSKLWNYWSSQTGIIEIIFGNGADATVGIAGNFAHQDWLEIIICNGLLGIFVYIFYYIAYAKSTSEIDKTLHSYTILLILGINMLLESMFSMSYNNLNVVSAFCIGVLMANPYIIDENQETDNLDENPEAKDE